jgi:hypothetical protein
MVVRMLLVQVLVLALALLVLLLLVTLLLLLQLLLPCFGLPLQPACCPWTCFAPWGCCCLPWWRA